MKPSRTVERSSPLLRLVGVERATLAVAAGLLFATAVAAAAAEPAPAAKNNLVVEAQAPYLRELRIEVTGPGLKSPLRYRLTGASDDVVGSIYAPPGEQRVFTIVALDPRGRETHRAVWRETIATDPAALFMVTLAAKENLPPIAVTFSPYRVVITRADAESPAREPRYVAHVTDPEGQAVAMPAKAFRWMVGDPRGGRPTVIDPQHPWGGVHMPRNYTPGKILSQALVGCVLPGSMLAQRPHHPPICGWYGASPGSLQGGMAAGNYHTCATTSLGVVKCWGANNLGQVGDNTTTDRHTPVKVVGLPPSFAYSLNSHGNRTCVVTPQHGLKCWGQDDSSIGPPLNPGHPNTANLLVPTDIVGFKSGLAAVATGFDYVCPLTEQGSVACWGYGFLNELGNGVASNQDFPKTVSTPPTVVAHIAVGYSHTCAIDDVGGVWCWGSNDYGQVTGTANPQVTNATPVAVAGVPYATALALGTHHTCAIVNANVQGAVQCWGGYGLPPDPKAPGAIQTIRVNGAPLTGVVAISAGEDHTLALDNTGAVWCWGSNPNGQCGDGTTAGGSLSYQVPVRPTLPAGTAVAIVAGTDHSCVAMQGGKLYCFGANSYGQLGNNTTGFSLVPVEVQGF